MWRILSNFRRRLGQWLPLCYVIIYLKSYRYCFQGFSTSFCQTKQSASQPSIAHFLRHNLWSYLLDFWTFYFTLRQSKFLLSVSFYYFLNWRDQLQIRFNLSVLPDLIRKNTVVIFLKSGNSVLLFTKSSSFIAKLNCGVLSTITLKNVNDCREGWREDLRPMNT